MSVERRSVLVVDDSAEDREAVRRVLAQRYELLETDSAEEALKLLQQHGPACILVDYSLGDRDAIEFLRELKGEAVDFPAAVVVLTGQGNERVAVQAMKLGAEDYVVKGELSGLPGVVQSAIERHEARRQRAYRILIVDDSAEDREFYRRRLPEGASTRFELREAENAAQGMAIVREWSPDCVLLDYALPDSDGLDFLAEMRHTPEAGGVAVVVLTGQGNEAVAVAALKAGAQDYVVKSSAIGLLREAVIGAVSKVRLERKLEEQRRALERSESALREAARRKDEFLAMLAHELRNPLAPLRTLSELLRMRGDDAQTVTYVREVLERQSGHLARLVDDLLDVTRITRGIVRLQRAPADLNRLAGEMLEDHRGAIERAGLTAALEPSRPPAWVEGDATRLAQVLGNIVGNAVKFTPRGGRIDIAVSADQARSLACITVRDTGVGIDAQTLGRVFEVFEQADHSLHRSDGGLGLGLAIAKGLVDLHGGSIRAESEGAGHGARFVIELPLGREPVALSAPPRAGGGASSRRGGRILIVDDNADAAETLRALIKLRSYEVNVAYDGPGALRLAREWKPDAVLCDIGLPGMNGFAVAKALRQDPATRHVRLIAITGYGSPQDRQRALESGFDDHMVKPADPQAVLQKLQG